VRRMALEVDDDLFNRANEVLPHGTKAAVIRCILEMIVDSAEVHGDLFIGALLNGNIALKVKGGSNEQAG